MSLVVTSVNPILEHIGFPRRHERAFQDTIAANEAYLRYEQIQVEQAPLERLPATKLCHHPTARRSFLISPPQSKVELYQEFLEGLDLQTAALSHY